MEAYRVNYSYAAPTGQLRTGAVIIQSIDADTAIQTVREMLIGKLKFLKVQTSSQYHADQPDIGTKSKK